MTIRTLIFKNVLRHSIVLSFLVLAGLYGIIEGDPTDNPGPVGHRKGSLEAVLESVDCVKAQDGADPSGVILRRPDGRHHYSDSRRAIHNGLAEEIYNVDWPAQEAVLFCK